MNALYLSAVGVKAQRVLNTFIIVEAYISVKELPKKIQNGTTSRNETSIPCLKINIDDGKAYES
jgi:hypothetical protein